MAGKVVTTVENLISPTIAEMGYILWDVEFVKEGASYYLRVYIDKPDGIDINDCTDVSRAIDPIIDEADPIDKAYYLEVCSPGINRKLSRNEHFEFMKGRVVSIHTYREFNGAKDIIGVLKSKDKENITLLIDDESVVIPVKNVQTVKEYMED